MAVPTITGAPGAAVRRPRVLVVGTAWAAAALLMMFAGLIGIYLTQRAEVVESGIDWLPTGVEIPLTQPNVMLFGLIMSVVTVHWAISAARNDDRRYTYLALGLTLLLGLAFVNMAIYLFSVMGLDMAANRQSVLIYTIAGAHVLWVVVSMFFLGFTAFRALAGQYTSRQYDGLLAAAVLWDAMVAAYVVIWFAVYITK
jgi:cytochrome c oxidase subunit 3